MSLSSDLISQFVKATKDTTPKKSETTVYATVVYDGKPYVKLDGSDLLTPVKTTASVKDGERVTVLIKDHTATITGNITSPSASTKDVESAASKISEFEILMAYKVTTEDLEAVNATIQSLRAKFASIDKLEVVDADIVNLEAKFADLQYVDADTLKAITADIESLEAKFGEFTDLETEDFEAINADIVNLKSYTADFTYVSAEVLEAVKASIKELDAKKMSVEEADIRYANIDFANIGEAAIEKLFTDSGLIKDLIVSEGNITGELVGVTIKGDLIEGSTIKADKLVVKGSDGLYYKLNVEAGATTSAEVAEEDLQNGLHGTAIIAKTITAEKVAVDDLVAFDATIGGFNITTDAIYSGVKSSASNATRGIYLDRDGQLSVGDMSNYLRYYKAADGSYKLEIVASELRFGASRKTVEEAISDIEIGGRNLIRNSTNLIFADYYFTDVSTESTSVAILGTGTLGDIILGKEK